MKIIDDNNSCTKDKNITNGKEIKYKNQQKNYQNY